MLNLIEDEIVAEFPYSPEGVVAVKKVPGSRWDSVAKVWRIPVASLQAAKEFADGIGLPVSEDIKRLRIPDHPLGWFGVRDEGDFLKVSFEYDEVKIAGMRQIPGASWNKKEYKWVVPEASLLELKEWMENHGLGIGKALAERMRKIQTINDQMINASRATDGALSVDNLGLELFPYQQAGVAYAVRAKRCFIADEMGLGKTAQALAAIEKTHQNGQPAYPVLVICPPRLITNWKKEIHMWLPHRSVSFTPNRKDFPGPADFVLIGDSNISHWEQMVIDNITPSTLVIDESHRMKNGKSQRAKSAVAISKQQPDLVFLLTGTPITNRPKEFVSQLKIMRRLEEFGGDWRFLNKYCKASDGSFDGGSNLVELNEILRRSCYIRRKKVDVLTELPPILKATFLVDPEAKTMKEYNVAAHELSEYLASEAIRVAGELGEDPRSAVVRAALQSTFALDAQKTHVLRKVAAMAKMPTVLEWAEGKAEAGQKVIIVAHHIDVVNAYASKLGGCKIQGGMSNDQVDEAKRRFMEDSIEDCPAIVISITAGGEGHNLTVAQDVLIAELPWVPTQVDQVVARAHRIGQTGSVTETLAIAEDTIDEYILDVLRNKKSMVDASTEGTPMVQEQKAMAGFLDFLREKGLQEALTPA